MQAVSLERQKLSNGLLYLFGYHLRPRLNLISFMLSGHIDLLYVPFKFLNELFPFKRFQPCSVKQIWGYSDREFANSADRTRHDRVGHVNSLGKSELTYSRQGSNESSMRGKVRFPDFLT